MKNKVKKTSVALCLIFCMILTLSACSNLKTTSKKHASEKVADADDKAEDKNDNKYVATAIDDNNNHDTDQVKSQDSNNQENAQINSQDNKKDNKNDNKNLDENNLNNNINSEKKSSDSAEDKEGKSKDESQLGDGDKSEKKHNNTSSHVLPPVSDVKRMVVCIDPGHSGVVASGTEPIGPGSSEEKLKDTSGTSGCVTKIPEYKLTLALSKKLKNLLEEDGNYMVIMTRTDHKDPLSCKERASIANKADADIFVRIHADGIDSQDVNGVSAHYPTKNNPYVSKYSEKSRVLSEFLLESMCHETKATSRGLFGRDDLSGSNWAKMPVSLIEVGFMSNPQEDKLLADEKYRNKIAQGLFKGIEKYRKKYDK